MMQQALYQVIMNDGTSHLMNEDGDEKGWYLEINNKKYYFNQFHIMDNENIKICKKVCYRCASDKYPIDDLYCINCF
jgi:hypothetical protein